MRSQLFTSHSDRWFTPPELLAEVRAFYGGSYFDPCPPRSEGERIDSGLWLPWRGCVFVNPPYGKAIRPWIVKAVTEPVDELLLLVASRTGSGWFQALYEFPICFFRGRLKFSGAENGATFDSALVYRGPRVADFAAAFGHRGPILRRYEGE